MRTYKKKTDFPAEFAELLEAINFLPGEAELDQLFASLRRVRLSGSESPSIDEFQGIAITFLNGLDQGLIDYLSRHADQTAVYSWCDLLESLAVQRKALIRVIDSYRTARRRLELHRPRATRGAGILTTPKPGFKGRPEKGSLREWFDANELPRFSLAGGDLDKELSLRQRLGAEQYLKKADSVSVKLWLTWDAEGHLRFRGMPLLQMLAVDGNIFIERLNVCPICKRFFYAKKLGAKRSSLTCGAKACSDTLGNLNRKKRKRTVTSSGDGSERRAVLTLRVKRTGGKDDAD